MSWKECYTFKYRHEPSLLNAGDLESIFHEFSVIATFTSVFFYSFRTHNKRKKIESEREREQKTKRAYSYRHSVYRTFGWVVLAQRRLFSVLLYGLHWRTGVRLPQHHPKQIDRKTVYSPPIHEMIRRYIRSIRIGDQFNVNRFISTSTSAYHTNSILIPMCLCIGQFHLYSNRLWESLFK